jgi:penicillin amidase
MLKNWDGNVSADSVPAAIYEITFHHMLTNTLSDELGSNLTLGYFDGMGGQALQAMENLLNKPDDPLWDNKSTPKVEKRDDIIAQSLTQAVGELASVAGSNMQDWTWGKVHQITPRHEFSSADFVGGLFTLSSQPLGGDNTTVSVGAYTLLYAGFPLQGPIEVSTYQSYRMIIDLSDWTKSEAIFATGASGQPGSKYWGNLYPLWLAGEYIPLLYTQDQINANKDAVLTMTP